MIQAEDLCQKCKHLNRGDYECNQKHYLDSWKFTIECEDFEEDTEDNEDNEDNEVLHT